MTQMLQSNIRTHSDRLLPEGVSDYEGLPSSQVEDSATATTYEKPPPPENEESLNVSIDENEKFIPHSEDLSSDIEDPDGTPPKKASIHGKDGDISVSSIDEEEESDSKIRRMKTE